MTDTSFGSLRLSDLPEYRRGVLRAASSTRPALCRIEKDGVKAVVKDYSGNGFLYRHTIGRLLVWRESKAYRRLKGLRGNPEFFGVIEGLALTMAEISGKNMEAFEKDERLPENFFKDLYDLVNDFHRRGLAHCDLKRAPNIMLGDDGRPYIIDWSAAISRREFRYFPLNLVYERFILDDLNAIVKHKLKYAPERVTREEKARYYHRSHWERFVRTLRDRARKLLQRLV